MAMCGHSRKEIVPTAGLFMALGQLLPAFVWGVSDTEHGRCHQGWLWDHPRGAAPSASKPFLQLLCSGGVTPVFPVLPGMSQHPQGVVGGVGGSGECSHVPIQSQRQIPADLAAQGNLSPPWVFALKGSTLYFTRVPLLCVLCLCVFGAWSSFQRHSGTVLGARAFPEVLWGDSCWIPRDRVAGQGSVKRAGIFRLRGRAGGEPNPKVVPRGAVLSFPSRAGGIQHLCILKRVI